MSLWWVIIGTFLQACLALFSFMLVAFSAGAIVNGSSLSRLQLGILNACLYLLPAVCLVCAGIVIYQYKNNATVYSYWWYAVPVVLNLAYLFYATRFNSM